jgi:putative acetyltransferase
MACTRSRDSDTLPPPGIHRGRTELAVVIAEERPDAPDAVALIDELDAHLASFYPSESRHGFSVDKLLREGVVFFVARDEGRAAGCGGVLIVGRDYAEVKRMYVRPAFRGRGLGRLMLDHLIAHARQHGLTVIRLETGIHQGEAIALYERRGFRRIPPFGPYWDDPVSRCYEMRLSV